MELNAQNVDHALRVCVRPARCDDHAEVVEAAAQEWLTFRLWRCRWCGRRVSGVFGWFHKPDKCEMRPNQFDNANKAD